MDQSTAQLQRLAIAPEQRQNHQIYLTSDQQHYLCDVLRLGHGDRFIAMNGQGQLWLAELQPDVRSARILHALGEQTELAMPMMLLAAPPKGNHFDQVVRSVTELGVSHIVPLISQRTLLKPSSNRIQRWQRIATEAAEQSHRQIIPKVLEPVSFEKKVMQDDQGAWQRYICTVEPSAPNFLHCLSQALDQESQSGVAVMVGPEGGWTETETQQAQTAGYQAVSLGQRTLRAVTANYMAVSIAIAQIELHTAYPGGKVCTKKSP
ncbi:16S rRNA (uracil(1498)-N(3))-methyltransferase [Acaryochloris sp. CCMEE 5410]|uniref:16S rRNA (uracil(1498)-N(3))-methyltransferase n=1 Tax=Acaryochloris sp. CCMEE 5410 TaxID=310037 RepID=UPI0002483B3C|nr:16S rRNA (uracil(1498)-N(3))-methyltransferase [Acaryochloris sp. CCMEE 5410]KAI9135066.1 16S rRNA (uracil(1498)-N(3))-methyltransferase [Acaryochloris sp. CCMEE 5410]